MFATELGIDIWNVVDAAATKPFGFMKFTPGPGIGVTVREDLLEKATLHRERVI